MNKKYQPSNGTEGYAFIDWQCHGCVKNTDPDDNEPSVNERALTIIRDYLV